MKKLDAADLARLVVRFKFACGNVRAETSAAGRKNWTRRTELARLSALSLLLQTCEKAVDATNRRRGPLEYIFLGLYRGGFHEDWDF